MSETKAENNLYKCAQNPSKTYHSNNDFIGDQFSAIHEILGLLSHLGLGRDGSSKHVTRRKMDDAKLFLDNFALCSLSTRGSSSNDNIHWIGSIDSHAVGTSNHRRGGCGRCSPDGHLHLWRHKSKCQGRKHRCKDQGEQNFHCISLMD